MDLVREDWDMAWVDEDLFSKHVALYPITVIKKNQQDEATRKSHKKSQQDESRIRVNMTSQMSDTDLVVKILTLSVVNVCMRHQTRET
jgi:predicted transposase YdaD